MKKRIKETGKRHMPPQSANETGTVTVWDQVVTFTGTRIGLKKVKKPSNKTPS